MSTFDEVRRALAAGRARVTPHAQRALIDDGVSAAEAIAATLAGEVIEDYPDARICPACLALGRLADGTAVHAVWAFDAGSDYAVMVTAYQPDPARWSLDLRKRVKR
jgi:hypothetical protein